MKRLLPALLAAALPALAARMTITSYGIPRSYALKSTDQVTIDESGLYATVLSTDSTGTATTTTYFFGYANKVTFDTVGGAFTNLFVNTSDSGASGYSLAAIDSITLVPAVDSSGDDDSDGLTNFEELMVYHTDPEKTDSDGDGLDDRTEAHLNQKVFSPLVANLTAFKVQMTDPPEVYLITSKSGETSKETSLSTAQSWGSESSSSTSHSVTNSEQIAAGFSFGMSQEVNFGTNAIGTKWSSHWEASLNVTQGYEVSNQNSYEQRASYSKSLETSKATTTTSGWEISGGKVVVPVRITNIGDVGFKLSDMTFTLYGTNYVNGEAVDHAICDLDNDGKSASLDADGGVYEVSLSNSGLTLAEVEAFADYDQLHVALTGSTRTYTLNGSSLSSSDVSTTVGASTARVEVDFGAEADGQESPMVRYVAALTKWLPESYAYAPVYLGEMLTQMGLTYSFDSAGFKSVNSVSRNSANVWWTGLVRSKSGGQASDTLEVRFGSGSGPDSVAVEAGDVVMVVYTGDDDGDGLLNVVEKLVGTDDSAAADYDGDGIGDSLEYYGWKKAQVRTGYAGSDTATYHTDPASWDSDGDGVKDSEDDDPLVPMSSSHSQLLKVRLLDLAGAAFDSVVFADTATLRATVANLGVAARFQIVVDSLPALAYATVGAHSDHFTFDRTSDTTDIVFQSASNGYDSLYRVGTDSLRITLKSLDGSRIRTWTLVGSSELALPTDLKLRKTSSRADILVSFTDVSSQDPRIDGYLIVRGLRADSATLAALSIDPTTSAWSQGSVVGSKFDVISVQGDGTEFDDAVGMGSPYYAYRVYSYASQSDDGTVRYHYAGGSQTKVRSVGRIQLHVKFPGFSGNDQNCSGSTNCNEYLYAWLRDTTVAPVDTLLFQENYQGLVGYGGDDGSFIDYNFSSFQPETIDLGVDNPISGRVWAYAVNKGNTGTANFTWNYDSVVAVLGGASGGTTNTPRNDSTGYANYSKSTSSTYWAIEVGIPGTSAVSRFHVCTWFKFQDDATEY